ncbi:MAG: RNA-splicing ligase RtcB, partial [Candidatus Korarchaeota archaeon NZ13-K]
MEAVLRKLDEVRWELPKSYKPGMRVPGLVFATEKLVKQIEARALEQLANVAMLPGIYKYSIAMPDIHEGYGFPIGGVAAFDAHEGIVSPGGVGYDINCLSPDSEVLTEHGFRMRISDLPRRPQGLRVYDVEEGHNDHSDLLFVAVRDAEGEAIRLITETGRSLEGSEDHPIMTPDGYRPMGELREGDAILVYPFDGVEYEEREGPLLEEDSLEDPVMRSQLRERGLIPLRWEDPRLGILARLLGFAMGSGRLGEVSGRISLCFHGSEETLREVMRDLERLGIGEGLLIRRDDRELRVEGALALLMKELGMPSGEKLGIPEWIKRAPLWVKRNFLAGLFGAEGGPVIFEGREPLPINLTRIERMELEDGLFKYLREIAELLKDFGIHATIQRLRKDEERVAYELSIVDEESIRTFLGRIGYEYDLRKREVGLWAHAYLVRKDAWRARSRSENSLQGPEAKESKLSFPTFEEFVSSCCLRGGVVIERVERVERVMPSYKEFYDVGVEHRAHNFIANGIVVHNCGVRLIRTDLDEKDVRPRLKQLVDALFENVPSGLGSSGKVRLSPGQLDEVIVMGARWAVEQGYGWERDLD